MPEAVEPGTEESIFRWARRCGRFMSLRRLPRIRGMTPPLSASPPGRRLVSCTVASTTAGVFCFENLSSKTMALTRAPFSNAHRASLSISFGVYFTTNDASGSPPLGVASRGAVATARDRVRFTFWPRLEGSSSGRWFTLPVYLTPR